MPILPKQRDVFPGDLLDDPAAGSGRHGRWILVQDERMLVVGPPANERLVAACRGRNLGALIALEDMDVEPR